MRTMIYKNTFLGYVSTGRREVKNVAEARALIEKWNADSKAYCQGIYAYELVEVI